MCLPISLTQLFQRIKNRKAKATTIPRRRITLLDLPPELRLQIYDRVLLIDLDFCIERASPLLMRSSNQALGESWDGVCNLPINILRQTSRLIANEVHFFMASLPDAKRVACIELCAQRLFFYSTRLRCLPCRIRQLRGLDFDIRIDMPSPMARQTVRTWVRRRVSDLSVTLVHFLEPVKGILKDAEGVEVVTLWALPPVEAVGPRERRREVWMATRAEVREEFRAQLEKEVEEVVRPQVGERRLVVA